MDVSVIIPTHNRAEKLEETLRALRHQIFDGTWEVVVVNNASADHTDDVVATIAADFDVPVRLVHEGTPGAAAARNCGARAAGGRVLLFLDDDMLSPTDLVAKHFETVTANPRSWVLGQARHPEGTAATAFGRYRGSLHELVAPGAGIVEVQSFSSGNCSMPAAELRLVGGYNEDFTTAALEDADLYVRARRNGYRVIIDPRIVTIHNDWAADSLESFCQRQRLYSRSAPILHARFGDDNPRAEWVRRNSPPSPSDSLPRIANKLARAAAGMDAAQRALYLAASALEGRMPGSRALRAVYRTAIAGSMYRGMSEGLRDGPPATARAEEATGGA